MVPPTHRTEAACPRFHWPEPLRSCMQVQAAHFLLASHPFIWNGLSFAHAAADKEQAQKQALRLPHGATQNVLTP